jgi:hypothetical protein
MQPLCQLAKGFVYEQGAKKDFAAAEWGDGHVGEGSHSAYD